MTTDGNKLMREISALILACLLALVTLALYSYAPADPGFNHQAMAGHKTQNLVGIVGAYMASALVDLCGGAAWLWPVFMALAAGVLFFRQFRPAWWRWLGGAILSVMLPVWIEHGSAALGLSGTGMAGGGFVGRSLEGFFQRNLGGPGAWGQAAKLTPTPGGEVIYFGTSVAVSRDGPWIAAGAPWYDVTGFDDGAAYVFRWEWPYRLFLPLIVK